MADPDLGSVLFRVDGASLEPEVVVLERDSAPERLVARGDHYENVADAWDWLERDVAAQQSLVAGEILRLRSLLARTEREAADAVIRAVEIKKRHEAWKGKK